MDDPNYMKWFRAWNCLSLSLLTKYLTGADGYGVPDFVCDIYFAGQSPCFGGVLALNGLDGSELWRHWTVHEVYALNCHEDITGDNIRDCLVAGRAGVRFKFYFCSIQSCSINSDCLFFGIGVLCNQREGWKWTVELWKGPCEKPYYERLHTSVHTRP